MIHHTTADTPDNQWIIYNFHFGSIIVAIYRKSVVDAKT